MLRLIGFYWGVAGVLALLLSAIGRLLPHALALRAESLAFVHWLALLVLLPFMAYAEGYRGFHRNFAPRVIARASYLRRHAHPFLSVFAPLFCMGFLHATAKRRIVSFCITGVIVLLVVLVRDIDQPWRGIIDAAVVLGLLLGVLSVLYHWLRTERSGEPPAVPLDLPTFPP